MKLIIDRFEEDQAVCEADDLSHINIPRSLLPEDVKEGSIVYCEDGVYTLCDEETEKRRKELSARTRRLFVD